MATLSIAPPKMGRPAWSVAGVAAIVATLALVFWSTSVSLVSTWNSSGTYSHGFLIVPAFFWLVWGRRIELASLPIVPTWWALHPLAVVCVLWLVGDSMALALPTQLAVVMMVPLVIAGVFGFAWVRALLFPLAFLFFAVPVGESLVPVLMDWTADFTVAALQLSGVPVYRDGLHFEIPSGKWSVVDSCSGIRYLFACLAVSSLYAWTIYRTTARRLALVGLAAGIAVIANWIRAYGIVMLGHLSNNQIATGVDHLVYGALFFAVIMALVFGLGVVWREGGQATAQDHAVPVQSAGADLAPPLRDVGMRRWVPAALAMGAVMLTVSIGGARPATATGAASLATQGVLPRGGWAALDAPPLTWQPALHNPASLVSSAFAKGGETVGMHVGLFNRPTTQSKVTSAMNRLLEPDGLNPQWKLAQQGSTQIQWGAESVKVRTAVLIGNGARLVAWQWYGVDGQVTADPARAAWLQMLARLRGRDETAAWIAIYTREADDPVIASRRLATFVADMAPSFEWARPSESMPFGLGKASED
jgi:exosortase A